MLPPFAYIRPRTLAETLTLLKQEGTAIHAGGTDLLGCLRERIMRAATVVSLGGLGELRGISRLPDGGLLIGALTTITALGEDRAVRRLLPAVAQAAAEVASPQLRNQGTIGGNLCQKPRCWYYRGQFDCLRKGGDRCYALGGENQFHAIFGHDHVCAIVHPSDMAPVLVALGAKVQVSGPAGEREVAVENLHVVPRRDVTRETVLQRGEIVTHVAIPAMPPGGYSSYRKVRARRAWDFALAGVALALTLQEGRIVRAGVVLAGAAPVPWRSRAAEDELTGRMLSDAVIGRAARAAVADAVSLADNGYKVALFRGLVEAELDRARMEVA